MGVLFLKGDISLVCALVHDKSGRADLVGYGFTGLVQASMIRHSGGGK